MIKRIIFDLDNTLIVWKKEYIFAIKNSLEKFNISYNEELILKIDNIIETYEKYYTEYNKYEFLNFINTKCSLNLTIDFINYFLQEQGKCYENDEYLINTIKYLNNKYELVVLTNYFTETQELRLKNLGILKYFKYVYGGDKHKFKPNKEAFKYCLEQYKPNECLMIGDKLNEDIIPAKELGINTIWVTDKNSNEYRTIKNIKELIKIL